MGMVVREIAFRCSLPKRRIEVDARIEMRNERHSFRGCSVLSVALKLNADIDVSSDKGDNEAKNPLWTESN
jgi:hypothetical protein